MYITMGTAVYGYISYEFVGLSEAHPACQESAVGLLFFYMLSHIVRITLQRDAVPLPTCKPAFELPLCLQVLGRLRDCVRYLHRMRQVCQEIQAVSRKCVKKMCQEIQYLHRMRRSIFWFLPWRPLTLSKIRESIRTHEAIAYAAPWPHVDINIRTTKTMRLHMRKLHHIDIIRRVVLL